MSNLENDLKLSLETLKAGGILLLPTDSFWVFACDAINDTAVEKLLKIEERNQFLEPFILLDEASRILSHVQTMPEIAWDLIELSDKPLILVFSGIKNLSKKLAPKNAIGMQVTGDAFMKKLIQRFKKPLAAVVVKITGKQANPGQETINQQFKHLVDYVVVANSKEKLKFTKTSIIQLGEKGEVKIIKK